MTSSESNKERILILEADMKVLELDVKSLAKEVSSLAASIKIIGGLIISGITALIVMGLT